MLFDLLSGDMIERPGPLGTKHVGIFWCRDEFDRAWVFHNDIGQFVRLALWEEFAAGQEVTLTSRSATNLDEQREIIARAQSLLGTRYDLLNFNCEHFATYAQSGVAISPQLQGFAFAAAIVLVMLAVASA